jgi:hypothetical protein
MTISPSSLATNSSVVPGAIFIQRRTSAGMVIRFPGNSVAVGIACLFDDNFACAWNTPKQLRLHPQLRPISIHFGNWPLLSLYAKVHCGTHLFRTGLLHLDASFARIA